MRYLSFPNYLRALEYHIQELSGGLIRHYESIGISNVEPQRIYEPVDCSTVVLTDNGTLQPAEDFEKTEPTDVDILYQARFVVEYASLCKQMNGHKDRKKELRDIFKKLGKIVDRKRRGATITCFIIEYIQQNAGYRNDAAFIRLIENYNRAIRSFPALQRLNIEKEADEIIRTCTDNLDILDKWHDSTADRLLSFLQPETQLSLCTFNYCLAEGMKEIQPLEQEKDTCFGCCQLEEIAYYAISGQPEREDCGNLIAQLEVLLQVKMLAPKIQRCVLNDEVRYPIDEARYITYKDMKTVYPKILSARGSKEEEVGGLWERRGMFSCVERKIIPVLPTADSCLKPEIYVAWKACYMCENVQKWYYPDIQYKPIDTSHTSRKLDKDMEKYAEECYQSCHADN